MGLRGAEKVLGRLLAHLTINDLATSINESLVFDFLARLLLFVVLEEAGPFIDLVQLDVIELLVVSAEWLEWTAIALADL